MASVAIIFHWSDGDVVECIAESDLETTAELLATTVAAYRVCCQDGE